MAKILSLKDIIKALKNKKETKSAGIDGYKSMEIAFAFLESAKNNGKTVKFPLKKIDNVIIAK